ncbi:MAG TPA: PQQ-binding-like beta-propeller repeat protein [Bryobacteraceae bacterium]|nr:PQQ-binding-like beta-propeller repeat protein [Bryobacteraceae bacterium]
MTRLKLWTPALIALALIGWTWRPAHGQQGAPAVGEWRTYGGDSGNTRYSPLDQINAANARNLQVVWRWKAQNMGPSPQAAWEVTPLMAGGKLYFTAGVGRTVAAADAATGETLWLYRGDDTKERGAVRANNRGLSYWSDGSEERVLFVTPGYQLVALNAKTGLPASNFGQDGHVDLWAGLDRAKVENGTIGATSPPIIIRDVAVVGAALRVGVALPTKLNTPGYIRGYDVHTGKLLWTFHTVPQAGEFGVETWLKDPQTGEDSWKFTGNTGAWGPLTGDDELGYVYIPVEAPSGDTFGGQRPGANLFSDTIVCLDAKTGKRIWHYQLIHHEMWDYDIPAAPILLDITVNGRKIKALAQVNKSAFLFVFDRTNGQPVWPIEERPVPQGKVPGEWYSPTQPFPTKPAPFDRQGVTEADLADYTPEIKAEALKVASQYVLGPIYTSPIVKDDGGKLGTIQLPGAGGGANWMGASVDAETGMLYVPSTTSPYISALQPGGSRSEMPYIAAGGLGGPNVMGLPLIKGPYGRITAINLNTGEHEWMIPNGRPADTIVNNPALKAAGVDARNWGGGQRSPILITKTLLIEGSDNLRFIDKKTGSVIYEMTFGANVTGGTMTYSLGGRQFIVAVVGGQQGGGAELVAMALPQPGAAGGRGGRGGGGRGGRGGAPPDENQ